MLDRVLERFWSKVRKSDGCWTWTGQLFKGYGRFRAPGKPCGQAHRFAFEMLVGPIPASHEIDHLCRNPSCVNPCHLEVVTSRENTLRGVSPTANNARKTHCKRGHPFDATNTKHHPLGRRCAICQRQHDADYKARRRAGSAR